MAFTHKTVRAILAAAPVQPFTAGQRVTTDPDRKRGLRGTVEAVSRGDTTRTPCYVVRWDDHEGLHEEAAFRLYAL